MNAKDSLQTALLHAFHIDQVVNSSAAAEAVANVLCAFAEVLRGPAPDVITGFEIRSDETPALILAELRELNRTIARMSNDAEVCVTPDVGR